MASYSDLLWQARASLPGVPLPLLWRFYAETVREFFLKSHGWQHNVSVALDLAAETAWPTIVSGTHIPAGTTTIEPVSVKWDDGARIMFKTRDQLDEIDGDWEQATASRPDYWSILGPGDFTVYPMLADDADESLWLRLAVVPDISTDVDIPDVLVTEFQEVWNAGVLSKLLAVPGKDWTSPGLAAVYKAQYEEGIIAAKSRAAADFGRPRRTTRYGGLPIGGGGSSSRDDYGTRR